MKKLFLISLTLILCFVTTACFEKNIGNEHKQPKELKVEQKSKIKNWSIKVTPKLDHKKWVYDTTITYLGNQKVNLTVKLYDNTKIEYQGVKRLQPLKTFGSYDYEGSVYSKKNSHLSITLSWSEGNNKVFTRVAEFKITPIN